MYHRKCTAGSGGTHGPPHCLFRWRKLSYNLYPSPGLKCITESILLHLARLTVAMKDFHTAHHYFSEGQTTAGSLRRAGKPVEHRHQCHQNEIFCALTLRSLSQKNATGSAAVPSCLVPLCWQSCVLLEAHSVHRKVTFLAPRLGSFVPFFVRDAHQQLRLRSTCYACERRNRTLRNNHAARC